jgi:hypothetical protein
MQLQPAMTFNQGIARFVSPYKEHVTWPIGPPSSIVVDNKVVIKPASYAQFENNRWSTNKPDYAQGMIIAEHFCDREGWMLDPMCLPDLFLEYWGSFSVETKRKIGLALTEGKDPAKVFDALTDADLEGPRAKTDERSPVEVDYVCPVSGCGLRIEGVTDPIRAKTALLQHQLTVHPDWQG